MKLSLFADDMTLYIENPNGATRKLLKLINEYSKVAGYKINMQKSLAFPHSKTENSEKKNLGNNPIHHCNKKDIIPRNKPI